jgi:polyhydroxybutyrate depolymerase
VWGPANYDPNVRYPVVLALHGWYADGPGHEAWFKLEDYTNNEALVVYPDAVGGLWDLVGNTDIAFFDDLVKQLGETYCINPASVLAFGFSYGGKFANHLGCRRAGNVKAIVVGDGSGGGDGQHCGRLPVLVTVRTHDTDERPEWGKAVAQSWSQLNQCGALSTTPDELNCVAYSTCKSPGAVTFCEDTFFEPTWPVAWNHTVRERYREFAWKWFKALP